MKEISKMLTLDRPAEYEIIVPGLPDKSWEEWAGGMTISVVTKEEDAPCTSLTGSLDQAALQGLLRRLYAMGLPLVSVICLHVG